MLTRTEQLSICKQCIHRSMDLQQGMICGLTSQKADFDDLCHNFSEDYGQEAHVSIYEPYSQADTQELKLNESAIRHLRKQQNLRIGIIAAVFAGMIGAALWTIVTVATAYQISFMAIAVGALVGFAMQKAGRGIEAKYAIWGAALTALSCVFGAFCSVAGYVATAEGLDFFTALFSIEYSRLPELLLQTTNHWDLIFYAIAIYEGFRFSKRSFDKAEMDILNRVALS